MPEARHHDAQAPSPGPAAIATPQADSLNSRA